MKARIKWLPLLLTVLVILSLSIFLQAVSHIENRNTLEDRKQLEDTLSKAVVACYSIEGAYPPSIDYLVETFGIRYNTNKYIIQYEYHGSNILPDITVLDR